MFIERIHMAFPGSILTGERISVFENFSLYEMKFFSTHLSYNIDGIKELFKHISIRDKLNISISYGEDASTQICSENIDTAEIDKEIIEINSYLSDEEMLEIKVTIYKEHQCSTISIYDFSTFSLWLFNKDLIDFVTCCNLLRKSSEYIIFECQNDKVYLKSGFVNFCTVGETIEIDNRLPKIDLITRQEVFGISSLIPIEFTPNDFHITGLAYNFPYKSYLDRLEMILSIVHLSNFCSFQGNSIHVIMKGYRQIEEDISFSNSKYNSIYYNIYDWVYSAGNLNDKVTLARNLISLSCKCKSIIDVDENILPAIQSNYNLYIKGNVKDYIALKNEVITSLQNYCNNVSEAINKYTGGLKSNFIAILGYIATVIFTKGIQKDTELIFTQEISILTSIILSGSLLICVISIIELCFKYRYFNKMISGLKAQYSDIMEDLETKKVVDDNPLLLTAKSNFRWSLGIVSIVWVITIVALFLFLDYMSGDVKLLFFINIFKNSLVAS